MLELNKKYTYNPEEGNQGLEAAYLTDGETLCIKIYGSNHWTDYALNLFAWPRASHPDYTGVKTHAVWTRWAYNLYCHLSEATTDMEIKEWQVIGHSMGGAVAALLSLFSPICTNVWAINAPKPGNRKAMKLIDKRCDALMSYDGGDIVRFFPFLYARFERSFRHGKTKPFLDAHNNKGKLWVSFPV